ncbi:heme o synthase [Estrella lausannensis]|uniref:Protoheme IX farnesyltransferase n=1 Tax=Estrella lausannensis TaxID=483423 RepID=A0A0H5DQS8_9BACT|nr:heme o synthase [Estrella lausannensis]CRX38468.1 Protoheme IX farnesyltransferase [Estrella lausannensis]
MINYTLLTKPGIILGNLITVAAGFYLGSRGHFDLELFLFTMLGLALIIASACVFNNYIDRSLDSKMERTKGRALAAGLISGKAALSFGAALGLAGSLVLVYKTNFLTFAVSITGFLVYVLLYSIWKPRTVYATAIGSIAGAVPPVAGYVSASGQIDIGASILFLALIFWQMPHFHAIALYRLKDYKKAEIPVLPVVKGVERTKIHMLLFILLFIPTALALTLFGYTGWLFFGVTLVMGLAWLALCLAGFFDTREGLFGKRMFIVSLLVINALCLMIPIDMQS